MPSPKRWFPVSRDLNDDPEVWEFTDEFGDRALRIVLEVFASIDKTDNHWRLSGRWLHSLSRKVRQQPATVQRAIGWMLAKGWLAAQECAADGSPMSLSAVNYWKYHKRRDSEGVQPRLPSGALNGSSPSLPTIPNRTEEKEILRSGSSEQERSQGQRVVGRARREEDLPDFLRETENFTHMGAILKETMRRLH